MQEYISVHAEQLNIKPEHIKICKTLENGFYVEVLYDKKKEYKLNKLIKHEEVRRILDEKVKINHKTWTEFNKKVKKSHRNKSSLIKNIVSLNNILKHIKLKLVITNINDINLKLKSNTVKKWQK